MQQVRRTAARLALALAATAQLAAPRAAALAQQQQQSGAPQQAAAAPTDAQVLSNLAGVVHDEAGNEIASVEVTVLGSSVRVLTDAHGAFLVRRVPVGTASVRVRRLGFVPQTVEAVIDTGFAQPLEIALKTLPIRLATVRVNATRKVYTGYLAEFNRRRDTHIGGTFFTAAQIDSLRPYRTTDLLRRVAGLSFTPAGSQTVVRSRDRRCIPLVWIDGMPAMAAYFDPDNIDPRSIAGIEVYTGLSTVPPTLVGPGQAGSCGVVAIWTRLPDPRRKGAKGETEKNDPKAAAERLAALVDSLKVYTVQQVDAAASLDPGVAFEPQYPDELRRTRQSGVVVAEFVVDAEGRIEPATLGVVTSTHKLFTAAVDSALANAVFRPATLAGRHVRQLVQLPVYFILPGNGSN